MSARTIFTTSSFFFAEMESHYPIHLISENYTFLEDLGQGCYGHVIKCLKQDTEDIVAVKVLKHSHSKIKNIREVGYV